MFSRSKGVELKARRKSKPITQQAIFVPSLAIWGAIVGAAMVYVLPYSVVKRLTPQPVFDAIAPNTHSAAMAIAAICGAVGMFVLARLIQRKAMADTDEVESDEFEDAEAFTIDPSEDLGSDSLDAPLEDETLELEEPVVDDFDDFDDFAGHDPEWVEDLREEDQSDPLNDHLASWAKGPQVGSREEDVRVARAEEEPEADCQPVEALDPASPEEDIVEEESAAKEALAVPVETAIAKLRAVSPQDLSLVQMVERLAVALHENKASAHSRNPAQARDAELAAALKTLSRLTEEGIQTTDAAKGEMREAISKLQNLRGAA